jgi:DNA-binding winged helix-turn-helix (wHTH) protein
VVGSPVQLTAMVLRRFRPPAALSVRCQRLEMNGKFRFDDFVLDLDARDLRRGAESIALSPKAYQLLEILVVERPKALSKLELQERLWPDTFVVEKNLVNLVAEIRAALGDNPSQARFVRTVPRFGYAFRESAGETVGHSRLPERSLHFRLRWADGHAVLKEGAHVMGRDPDLEICVDSPSVSRRHAMINVSGVNATIEDLGSKNGTFVADRAVSSPVSLADGDVIRLGPVEVTFTIVSSRRSTRTEAPRRR